MATPGFYLGDEPLDTGLDFGVAPLASLESQRRLTPRTPATPSTPATPEAGDDGNMREFLAMALLSLGEGMGGKTPTFLNNLLNERSKNRLAEASNKRLIERQELSNQRTLERQEESDIRKEQRAESAAQRKTQAEEAKAAKLGEAVMDVNEDALRTGLQAIHQSTRLNYMNRLIRGGASPDQARKLADQIGTKWEMSKDGSMMLEFDASTGRLMREVPREVVTEVGDRLIRRYGNDVLSTYLPPVRQKLSEGEEVQTLPGKTVPGPGASAAPGAMPPTSGAQIQLTGGGAQPAAAPVREGPTPDAVGPAKRTVIPADDAILLKGAGVGKRYVEDLEPHEARLLQKLKLDQKAREHFSEKSQVYPTAEQAPLLTKRGIPTNMTWEQIRQKYPNAAEVYIADKEIMDAQHAAAIMAEKRKDLAAQAYPVAFPTSTKVIFNKSTRERDDVLSLNDVAKGKAVLLDSASAQAVMSMNATMPSLDRLEKAARAIVAVNPGMNALKAMQIAVQRGLATSEDVAVFDALSGTLGIQLAAIINQGRPTDADANAIRASFAKTTDTVKTASAKFKVMRKLLVDSVDSRLGVPVAPLTRKSLTQEVPEGKRDGIMLPGGQQSNDRAFGQ